MSWTRFRRAAAHRSGGSRGAVLERPPLEKCTALIGVGSADWFRCPLPPNRTGGSPASGSPVGGLTFERTGTLRHGLLPSKTARAQ
jgi:hypothetical protein